MNSPEQLSARQFADALQKLTNQITGKQWEMLCFHYQAPDRSVTARQLAKEVGFKNHGAGNLQYGRLGSLLGSVLGFEKRNSSMLATFIKPEDTDNSEWLWVMLPALAEALELIHRAGPAETSRKQEAEHPLVGQGRDLSIEELDSLSGKLPWVVPNVFIMPPHEYVVEKNLKTEVQLKAFAALSDACAHHPKRWKAFFRGLGPKVGGREARTNIGLWDGIPLGFKGSFLVPKIPLGNEEAKPSTCTIACKDGLRRGHNPGWRWSLQGVALCPHSGTTMPLHSRLLQVPSAKPTCPQEGEP